MATPKLKIDKLSRFRPQAENANLHTERGMGMLDTSMSRLGFFDGMTAAADGEIIDGSARLEVSATKFADEAIVIEHDGTRPIVEVRTDIPNADDPKAKEIALAANQVAAVNLNFDPAVMQSLEKAIDLTIFFNESELKAALTKKETLSFLDDEPLSLSSGAGTSPSEQARHPLAIVLTNAQKREWEDYKEQLGVSSDTAAFVELFKGRKQ